MSVRPPTLRGKRRYLLARIEPDGAAVDPRDLFYSVAEAVTSLWGDSSAAFIQQAVISCDGPFAIIRCQRGAERETATALSTVTACREERIALRVLSVSGTIESLREKIAGMRKPSGDEVTAGAAMFDSHPCEVIHCDGQKLDVIEKGFKNTNRFYLTRDDMEEL